ncbi:hypothetical protein [Candidatus Nitrosocosmicus franklandus]|nr:hypothetical protein [Candidatus Nitrosocosmicus franklandus]
MKDATHIDTSGLNSFSPTLITIYSQRAVSTIRSIERILYLLLSVLMVFAVLVFIDTAAVKGYIKFIPEDEYDYILSLIAFAAIGIIIFMLRIILKTRKKLDNWAYTFEKNSIGSLISMGLPDLDKKTLFFSIIENIEEIGEPIKKYISKSKDNIELFLDQTVSDTTKFDILIDGDKIKSIDDGISDNAPIADKLNEYGIVVGKIIADSSAVDTNKIKLFIRSTLDYSKFTNKYIGLALLVGTEITNEAMEYARNFSSKSIGYLIVIEKPGIMNSL